MLFSIGFQIYESVYDHAKYNLSERANLLLGDTNERYAKKLVLSQKEQKYLYNPNYVPSESSKVGPRFSAEFALDTKKGEMITDTVNKTSVTFKPKFNLEEPIKQQNRLIYPFSNNQGAKVVTAKASTIKEDLILEKYQGDEVEFKYQIVLPAELEARIENDGSLGIYGPSEQALYGQASTGSEKDAKLLDKARQKAEKNNLVFRSPAPFLIETGKKISNLKAWYSLEGDILVVHAKDLNKASYPLTIDPSVYVETASKLMRGNNETNLDFDVDNELIQKGKLTGARFDTWSTTNMTALNAARWNSGTAVMGGYVYVVGGSSGSSNVSTVYWAHFNNSNYTIESPNPGEGTCSGWCNNSVYDLPNARAGLSLVAYNGFLYALGGDDSGGTATNTVYITKIGANGEPQLWHPSGGSPVYWYPSTNTLSSNRSYSGAVAYNNRLYLLGGKNASSTGGVTTVEYTDLKPTGDISNWSSTGMVALPSARHNHGVQVYNDRIYLIGGNSSGTLQNSTSFIKLKSDGTMNGSWQTTASFTTARMAWGGSMSTIWGGYIYMAGGCSVVNASGYCTTIKDDIQIASINADGTLSSWEPILGVTSSRIGYGFVGWRGNLYGIGGCTAQNTSTGACTTTVTTTNRGYINQDGDASTVSNSVPDGTSPCVSTTYYDCDIPPEGTNASQGGNMSGGTIINNGFIYYIGGCTAVAQNNVCFTGNAGKSTDNIFYAAISSDGTLVRPSICSGNWYGSWCIENVNTLASPQGLAAFGYAVFNNVIYVVGGTTGINGNGWKADVWRVGLNPDGSLVGAWTSQTFTALSLGTGRGYMYVFTRANPNSASTYPGNLYVLGGCSSNTDGLDCATQSSEVYKCNIKTDGSLEEVDGSDCSTTNQLQIDSEAGAGNQGLGVMAGTVYANYIYLVGGQSPSYAERGSVLYAKIDNSNNIVAVSGGVWHTSPNELNPVRRRGVAFGYNGYLYALAGWSGSSGLQDLLFAKINVSDGSIGPFTTSTVTVSTRWDLRAAVNNGWVYTLGGCSAGSPPASCSSMTRMVQTFQLYNNNSGSAAAYSASGNLFTTDRIGASSAVLNGYIYVAGGCTSATDCTTSTDNVQFAAINADGTLGTWNNTNDSTLPDLRAYGQLEAAGGTLYYIGGQSSTATDERAEVYYGTPNGSGDVTSWNTAANGLPAARTQHSAAVWNNRIYVTGGKDINAAATNTVYVSPQLNSGGDIGSAWSSTTGFNVARSGLAAIAYANNLYILGGYDGTNYLNDVQFTQINDDGTVDSWSYSTSLPQRTRQADGFAANGFMYIFGGRSADATCTNFTYVAPISANTTIASGNNPTGVGEWYATNKRFTTNRYGVAAAYYDGKAYVLGGACGATLTYSGANRVAYSTLQSQPQVAKYSRMIDTDTDVFPTKWLMNGLDNHIGARWYMNYRSSTNAAATWGQDTYFGAITLGQPENYIPKDSGGTNTNFARYYYIAVNIDSQQAFGYPEDVTRGPTIADLSLFFTADPSKRMRHGKTFTGGELQPLDTPF